MRQWHRIITISRLTIGITCALSIILMCPTQHYLVIPWLVWPGYIRGLLARGKAAQWCTRNSIILLLRRYLFVDKWLKTGIVGSAPYVWLTRILSNVVWRSFFFALLWWCWLWLIILGSHALICHCHSIWITKMLTKLFDEQIHTLLHAINGQRWFNYHWCKKLLKNTK